MIDKVKLLEQLKALYKDSATMLQLRELNQRLIENYNTIEEAIEAAKKIKDQSKNAGAGEKKEKAHGSEYENYRLKNPQIQALNGRKITGTDPDGNCTFSAFIECTGLAISHQELRDMALDWLDDPESQKRVVEELHMNYEELAQDVKLLATPGGFGPLGLTAIRQMFMGVIRIDVMMENGNIIQGQGGGNSILFVQVNDPLPHFYGTTGNQINHEAVSKRLQEIRTMIQGNGKEKEPSMPSKLTINASEAKNKWDVAIVGEGEEDLFALYEGMGKGDLKQYIGKKGITKKVIDNPKVGHYELKDDFDLKDLKGILKQAYEKAVEEKKAQDLLDAAREKRLEKGKRDADGSAFIPQKASLDRLDKLYNKRRSGKGHSAVQMLMILLDRSITIVVGGQKREITHLYVQVGNETERRCYLGNKNGVYQRVHTSLTLDRDMSAHTMVQFGKTIGVPPLQNGGHRVGYDSVEEDGKGYAERSLKPRSKKQCEVDGFIKGYALTEVPEEVRKRTIRLAEQFNAALDQALRDIQKGEAQDRDVRPMENFSILDEKWDGDEWKGPEWPK